MAQKSVHIDRDRAADISSELGFKVCSSVSKKTHFLVLGVQDLSLLAGHEKITKHRKAEEMISLGLDIQIITENDFINMISDYNK